MSGLSLRHAATYSSIRVRGAPNTGGQPSPNTGMWASRTCRLLHLFLVGGLALDRGDLVDGRQPHRESGRRLHHPSKAHPAAHFSIGTVRQREVRSGTSRQHSLPLAERSGCDEFAIEAPVNLGGEPSCCRGAGFERPDDNACLPLIQNSHPVLRLALKWKQRTVVATRGSLCDINDGAIGQRQPCGTHQQLAIRPSCCQHDWICCWVSLGLFPRGSVSTYEFTNEIDDVHVERVDSSRVIVRRASSNQRSGQDNHRKLSRSPHCSMMTSRHRLVSRSRRESSVVAPTAEVSHTVRRRTLLGTVSYHGYERTSSSTPRRARASGIRRSVWPDTRRYAPRGWPGEVDACSQPQAS